MHNRTIRGGLALAALLCVSACGDKVDRNAPLAFVPDDSPWVFANLEPVPETTRARFEQQMQAAWPLMLEVLDRALADLEKAPAADATVLISVAATTEGSWLMTPSVTAEFGKKLL